jgi:hypothetical protein
VRSGRFSVVNSAINVKEGRGYAVKVVENKSLTDEENLEALETEVRDAARRRCGTAWCGRGRVACRCSRRRAASARPSRRDEAAVRRVHAFVIA